MAKAKQFRWLTYKICHILSRFSHPPKMGKIQLNWLVDQIFLLRTRDIHYIKYIFDRTGI